MPQRVPDIGQWVSAVAAVAAVTAVTAAAAVAARVGVGVARMEVGVRVEAGEVMLAGTAAQRLIPMQGRCLWMEKRQ
jgi:hypothetical protein